MKKFQKKFFSNTDVDSSQHYAKDYYSDTILSAVRV